MYNGSMSGSISGPNFGRYEAAHLRAVPRKSVESVAPNVLRDLKAFDLEDEVDEEELLRLLTQDEIQLSEEAKEILRRLKERQKKRGRGRRGQQQQSEEEFLELLAQIEESPPPEPKLEKKTPIRPFIPPVIGLSGQLPGLQPTTPPPPRVPARVQPARIEEPEEDYTKLNRAGRVAFTMVSIASRKSSVMKVARDLEVFGSDMVSEVKRFGVRIVIADPHQPLTSIKIGGLYIFGAGEKTFDGRPWEMVRGVYSSKRKVICIGEELLDESQRSGRSTVRHEFAHAYEDVWSRQRQRRHPLSVELWYRFEQSRKAFISAYASTQPAEYFAESVEAFFMSDSRRVLAEADPEMYHFLSQLFAS